jgi:hypothetical protein
VNGVIGSSAGGGRIAEATACGVILLTIEQRGRTAEARLPEWGRSLFESLFGSGKSGHDAYLKSREGPAELVWRLRWRRGCWRVVRRDEVDCPRLSCI